MTGPKDSVLGVNKTVIINRFVSGTQHKFEIATGKGQFCGCIFTVNDTDGKCTDIERLYIEE
ncbi:MAG: YmdB family metallophosphoesterase, partial [Clostridia bacterium]|nr:YmdB family metallophosphoesterase [Clostridia bacterium]